MKSGPLPVPPAHSECHPKLPRVVFGTVGASVGYFQKENNLYKLAGLAQRGIPAPCEICELIHFLGEGEVQYRNVHNFDEIRPSPSPPAHSGCFPECCVILSVPRSVISNKKTSFINSLHSRSEPHWSIVRYENSQDFGSWRQIAQKFLRFRLKIFILPDLSVCTRWVIVGFLVPLLTHSIGRKCFVHFKTCLKLPKRLLTRRFGKF